MSPSRWVRRESDSTIGTSLGSPRPHRRRRVQSPRRARASRGQASFDVGTNGGRLAVVEALRLPTFTFENRRYIKRLTLVNRGSRIEKVFYPVFPSDRNAADVLAYLRASED